MAHFDISYLHFEAIKTQPELEGALLQFDDFALGQSPYCVLVMRETKQNPRYLISFLKKDEKGELAADTDGSFYPYFALDSRIDSDSFDGCQLEYPINQNDAETLLAHIVHMASERQKTFDLKQVVFLKNAPENPSEFTIIQFPDVATIHLIRTPEKDNKTAAGAFSYEFSLFPNNYAEYLPNTPPLLDTPELFEQCGISSLFTGEKLSNPVIMGVIHVARYDETEISVILNALHAKSLEIQNGKKQDLIDRFGLEL